MSATSIMSEITFHWLDAVTSGLDHSDWEVIESVLRQRAWMSLNRHTSRVLIAEREGKLVAFFVFQLVPFVGPMWADRSVRGQGLAEEMARQMFEFLMQSDARGWIASGESEFGERICREFGMRRIEHEMYITVGMEESKVN